MPSTELKIPTNIKNRLAVGSLYRFENDEISVAFWQNNAEKKYPKRLKTGDIVLFLRIVRSTSFPDLFRVYMIRGEEIGFSLLKPYEVISCFKLLDTNVE
jgi:hypothetical protein